MCVVWSILCVPLTDSTCLEYPTTSFFVPCLCSYYFSYYYYFWPVFVSWWCAHSRAVLFHTLYIVQRDTIICPYLDIFATFYYLPLSQPRSIPLLPLLLFHPIPVLLCQQWFRLPCAWQVNYRLIPPPHPHLRPLCPFCILTKFQKQSRSYGLSNGDLTSPYLLFHCVESCLLTCSRRQGVLPFTVCPPPW